MGNTADIENRTSVVEKGSCGIGQVAFIDIMESNMIIANREATPAPSLQINAANPGTWGDRISVSIEDGSLNPANAFNLIVIRIGYAGETIVSTHKLVGAQGRSVLSCSGAG
jgi:hypothetical protein